MQWEVDPIAQMDSQSTEQEARRAIDSQKDLLPAARQLAQEGLYGLNLAAQSVGREDSQENGTYATIFPLFGARTEDMKTADLLKSFDVAPPLSVTDIVLNKDEGQQLDSILQHAVLRIIVTFGGERFSRFRNDVMNSLPITDDKIPVHKTEVYPLPVMNNDESTGVIETVFSELGQPMSEDTFADTVRIVSGDRQSIAHLRFVRKMRVGHDHFRYSLLNMAFVPGLFQYQIHLAAANLETHWGNPSRGARDPGSLSFHNVVLDREPIVPSSTPPYHTCRDLISISLYARVLHCLQLVSGIDDLDKYAATTSFSQLVIHAQEIVRRYADPKVVADLRDRTGNMPRGDMVFENAVLFMRDGLIMQEFTDAIKGGDSGRVVLIMKILALSYQGTGRIKYACEALSLLHHLIHVWPQPIRDIVLKNWLVNPTGRRDGFIPIDLLQEHMKLWMKTTYNAQGTNATQPNASFGSRQGTEHHTPDHDKDISELINSLRLHRVYSQEPGRIIEDKAAVPNVISSGLRALVRPLREYNAEFELIRKRSHHTPLIGPPYRGRT